MTPSSFQISALRLGFGDVLVIKTDRVTSAETDKHISDRVTPLLPQGVKVLGVEISVITKAEIEAKVA
jgi:hypothetical protein